uniref:SUN domain-containing protein n=1 Tax=Gongylonema pulchrum TaxID=637853 RepID=A0A183EPE7_9BILA
LSVPACILGLLPVCNPSTGLYSGACPMESVFLNDINREQGYEGKHIFSIYSKTDQWVGYSVCYRLVLYNEKPTVKKKRLLQITTQVPGQHGEKVYENKNHDQTFQDSYEVQRQMVLTHNVV